MTNEKLIVKAAITIREADGALSHGDAVRYAEAALAVFEKTLGEATVTPTDDEREALTKKATTPDRRLEYHLLEGESVTMYPYWAADLRTVIAGFRRSERQGEPSDAQVEHVRRALKAADIDYSAREQRADAGGGDMEPGDWFTFLARAALRADGGVR